MLILPLQEGRACPFGQPAQATFAHMDPQERFEMAGGAANLDIMKIVVYTYGNGYVLFSSERECQET